MIQSTYLTVGWRPREKKACQIPLEEVGDEIYVHIYIQHIQSQEQGKKKYETPELIPKIDHKISSTKSPKERRSKKTTK